MKQKWYWMARQIGDGNGVPKGWRLTLCIGDQTYNFRPSPILGSEADVTRLCTKGKVVFVHLAEAPQ